MPACHEAPAYHRDKVNLGQAPFDQGRIQVERYAALPNGRVEHCIDRLTLP